MLKTCLVCYAEKGAEPQLTISNQCLSSFRFLLGGISFQTCLMMDSSPFATIEQLQLAYAICTVLCVRARNWVAKLLLSSMQEGVGFANQLFEVAAIDGSVPRSRRRVPGMAKRRRNNAWQNRKCLQPEQVPVFVGRGSRSPLSTSPPVPFAHYHLISRAHSVHAHRCALLLIWTRCAQTALKRALPLAFFDSLQQPRDNTRLAMCIRI